MEPTTGKGIVTRPSIHTVDETLERIRAALEARSVKIFAIVDHSGEAARAGLHMPATKVVIFGNPNAGTPLMLSAPSTAIDLPLKILVAEGHDGEVWVSWNDPDYLQQRHGFSSDLLKNIAVVEKIAMAAAS
jgi:uncharacterized protein (DUF302 family)